MSVRTLIVDDEPLARLNLSTLLADEPDFDVVGECADAPSAVAAIAATHPALVFLDVQMPGQDGFEVLQGLHAAGGTVPAVVFVTAHEQFALHAFDAQAVDYLLKPFRRERFATALARVRQHLSGIDGTRAAGIGEAGASPPLPRNGVGDEPGATALSSGDPERMVVKSGHRYVFIRYDELEFIRAAANYVSLHVGTSTWDVREKIGDLAARLPARRFLRIHRSYIVNVDQLACIEPAGGGEYIAVLRSGRQLPVGASYPSALRQALT
ncbi:MAG TPA: response regulator [Burkholderiaceae bacterium]|jgi:two-component system LytT family response regulator|nr:response regulator [Burkholderiaceae bacterium]